MLNRRFQCLSETTNQRAIRQFPLAAGLPRRIGGSAMQQFDGFAEGMWETLIALIVAAGICVSVINLAAHLNETSAVLSAHAGAVAAEVSQLSAGDGDAAQSTSRRN
jgi:hypothetical protein